MSFFVTWERSRLFVNTFTVDEKYHLLTRDYLRKSIQMHLFDKQKDSSHLFCPFFKPTLNFQHFQKKMTVIAYVFPKLRTPK